MVSKHRDNNPSGLGRAIINKKAKDARHQQESGIFTTDDSNSHLKSVTQERDLDEFFNTAQLAGRDFTAERRSIKIIQQSTRNPYLLTNHEEKAITKKHEENKPRLRVPRRPPWSKHTTISQLERQEKDAFLNWRRGLAELQEKENLLLTPFERNLEVWRQLWRVLERSHLIVQIVDARNPLRFRCEDLESYVKDIEGSEGEIGTGKGKRRNLLLINKADLLTRSQRRSWAEYFDKQGVEFAFFSAANAAALQRMQSPDPAQGGADRPTGIEDDLSPFAEPGDMEADSDNDQSSEPSDEDAYFSAEEDLADQQSPKVKVLSVVELQELFEKVAPAPSEFVDSSGKPAAKRVVGLVGYPNVGKSSTINALLGEKKVSVSSTPGKTKHFQTIHLSESIILCDCPGLVFPQFATTKADLVCDGVLPIDQMREYTGPIALVVDRIPKQVLAATYGLTIKVKGVEEGGNGTIAVEDLLIPYAIGRGYMRSGQGNPDEARSARYILKDYVKGKLLFARPPPGLSDVEFNQPTHELALLRAASKKRAPVTRVGKGADTFVPLDLPSEAKAISAPNQGLKSQTVDREFFGSDSTLSSRPFVRGSVQNGQEFTRAKLYPHQNAVADDGTSLGVGDARVAANLANIGTGKRHRKPKRVKQRSGKGYD